MNSLTGHHLARLNNPRKAITLRLLGNLDAVEPCWNEPIAISGAGENVRGLTLSGTRFLLTGVSVAHSNEPGEPPKTITWTLEGVTSGDAGITLDVPEKVNSTPKPPRATPGKKIKPVLLSPGTSSIAALNEDGYVYITRNFNAVTPTWTRYAIPGMGGDSARLRARSVQPAVSGDGDGGQRLAGDEHADRAAGGHFRGVAELHGAAHVRDQHQRRTPGSA